MKRCLLAALCLLLSASVFAQTADTDPATKDDIILYLQTMHTNDMVHKIMEVMAASMQQSMHDELAKQKVSPADNDGRMKMWMDGFVKNMPLDEMEQAMIPAYQRHFTHADVGAMNAFYSSPVGQKVLHELPDVMQEGMQAMRPIMTRYIEDCRRRMMEDLKNNPGTTKPAGAPEQN